LYSGNLFCAACAHAFHRLTHLSEDAPALRKPTWS
jgi:hypothetical protein